MMIRSKFDDGGSFERLVRMAEEESNGDKNLKEKLLTEIVVREFVEKIIKDQEAAAAAATAKTKTPCVFGFNVPKRVRRGPCGGGGGRRKPLQPQPIHDHQDKKICFDRIIKTSNIVQEPENLKQNKRRKITKEKMKQNKRRKITKANFNQNGAAQQEVIPEMPERFKKKIEEMGGSQVVLVIQKELMACDTRIQNNRYSIPIGQIVNNFLEPEEKERLDDKNAKMENVKLIEPCVSKVTGLTLKKWDMPKPENYKYDKEKSTSYTYNLISAWYSKVVRNADNELKIGSKTQLYAFRIQQNNNELCFALVNLCLEEKLLAI